MQEREKAIELAVSQIEKQFGKGSIMRLGSDQPLPDVPAIPTGAPLSARVHGPGA